MLRALIVTISKIKISDLNGGFWGPYQEDDLPGNKTKEITDEDYDTEYEDDEEEPFNDDDTEDQEPEQETEQQPERRPLFSLTNRN